MSDKLQLHEIAGYLPYEVKCQYEGIVNGAELKKWDSEINLVSWSDHADYIKEFPRPQEDLKDKIALIKDIKGLISTCLTSSVHVATLYLSWDGQYSNW